MSQHDDVVSWVLIAAFWLCWSASNIAYRLRSISASLERLVTLAEKGRR